MQQIIGITSSFTKTEYLAVMKELVAKKTGRIASQAETNDAMRIFDEFIINMGIEYFDSDDLIVGIDGFFSSCHIRVDFANPVQGNDRKWRGLGGADSIVLLMAESCSSEYIATNDDGFRQISSAVKPLLIKDEYT
jgi:hypothetical protein